MVTLQTVTTVGKLGWQTNLFHIHPMAMPPLSLGLIKGTGVCTKYILKASNITIQPHDEYNKACNPVDFYYTMVIITMITMVITILGKSCYARKFIKI